MIGRLRGRLVEERVDGTVILDVHGVGYEVVLPLGTIGRLVVAGDERTVQIHTHVREDAIVLYGFANEDDRAAFRALLGVSNVGPKLALAVLSRLDAAGLALAIARADKVAFKGISGVGGKTVERILLELKDKLLLRPLTSTGTTPAVSPPVDEQLRRVAATLVHLGYKSSEAERAAATLEGRTQGRPLEALVREALAALG